MRHCWDLNEIVQGHVILSGRSFLQWTLVILFWKNRLLPPGHILKTKSVYYSVLDNWQKYTNMGVRKVMFRVRIRNVINQNFTLFVILIINDKLPGMLSVVWLELFSSDISAVSG